MAGQSNFAATVDAWVRETDQRLTAVFRESAQEVIGEMQTPVKEGGRIPIDTGFLRSSLIVSVNQEPVMAGRANPNPKAPKGSLDTYQHTVASLAIAGAEIGDVITASYSAVYAPVIEYGAEGRAPRGFVRGAAAQWSAIVGRVTARLKSSAAASQR